MQIGVEQLYNAFRYTYSPVEGERRQAEQCLQAAEKTSGYLQSLLRIAVEHQVEVPIRQAAVIQLKNQVRQRWVRDDGFAAADKDSLRGGLVQAMENCGHPGVRKQLEECVRLVAREDFPEHWQGLLVQVCSGLASGSPVRTYCSLLVLRKVTKKYMHRYTDEHDAELEGVVTQTFPSLLTIGVELLGVASQPGPRQIEAFEMLKNIMKSFHSATNIRLGRHVQDNVKAWMDLVLATSRSTMPAELLQASVDEQENSPFAKCQKWVFQILYRWISRHGNTKRANDDMEAFADAWSKAYGATVTKTCLEVLGVAQGRTCVPRRTQNLALSCLAAANSLGGAYTELKGHLHDLLQGVVFPLLCFGAEDLRIWQEDPEETIRRMFDVHDMLVDPRKAALEFARELVDKRKDTLVPLLQFVQQHFDAHAQNPNDPSFCSRKDGALHLLGAIAERLVSNDPAQQGKAKKKVKAGSVNVEELLKKYVLPDMCSSVAFLRLRACWVYEQFIEEANMRFMEPASAASCCRQCMSLVSDSELPVRVYAGTVLRCFLDRNINDALIAVVVENVAGLLDRMLKMMTEIQCEELGATLECLVRNFPQQIAPFASQLVAQLSSQFLQAFAAPADDDDACGAAAGTMATLVSLCRSCVGEVPKTEEDRLRVAKIVGGLVEPLVPLFEKAIHPDGIDFYEEILELLACITSFGPKPFHPRIYCLMPRLYQSICGGATASMPLPSSLAQGWAIDMLECLVCPVANFIALGPPEAFMAGVWAETGMTYPDMVFGIVQKALQQSGAIDIESEVCCVGRLVAAFFENVKAPLADMWLPRYFEICWGRMGSSQTEELRGALLQGLASMLWYNADLFLRCTEEKGCTSQVFEVWVKYMSSVRSIDGKKIQLLGFLRLLQMTNSQSLPATLTPGLPTLVKCLATLTSEIAKLRTEPSGVGHRRSQDSDEDIEDEDDDDDAFGCRDDEDAVNPGASKLKNILAKINGADGDDDESVSDDFDEAEDVQSIARTYSAVDNVDEFKLLLETLQQAPAPMQQQVEAWLGSENLIQWRTTLQQQV